MKRPLASLTQKLQDSAMTIVDLGMAAVPRHAPAADRLAGCRLVAHRGSHDAGKGRIRENTLAAFDLAIQAGAWGVEFDVSWTVDDVPVIHHDANTERMFGLDLLVGETDFKRLRDLVPDVPTLEETLQALRGQAHAMIELKNVPGGMTPTRRDKLQQLLSDWVPGEDYHLMSLTPNLLLDCEWAPRSACLPIAEVNIAEISEIALREKFGGITGHYALITQRLVERHHQAGQKVGTGFASSRSVLFRELERGIDWIFSNHVFERALDLRHELDHELNNEQNET